MASGRVEAQHNLQTLQPPPTQGRVFPPLTPPHASFKFIWAYNFLLFQRFVKPECRWSRGGDTCTLVKGIWRTCGEGLPSPYPSLGLPCQPTNHWIPLLWTCWAYLGPALPTSKSLDSIALGLLRLPWGYLCQPAYYFEKT